MAPPPEYDKEPKAPDKSATNIPSEDPKALYNLVNEHQTNSDTKATNSSGNAEVENNKHVETLDDGQLRALLDEAITYKCPKDREGKSSLFKELLEEVEQDEQACEAAARLPGRARRAAGGRGRRALPHSNSLQDLVAALAAEPAPRRARHAPAPAPVSARAIHGGSLPSGVDTSFLLSEEPMRGAEYVATVRCVNPSPLAERRVSASDAHAHQEADPLNRRSKPAFPMTYTARATLEIGSGSVGSGRAVTTTTASNQVRTHPAGRPPTPGRGGNKEAPRGQPHASEGKKRKPRGPQRTDRPTETTAQRPEAASDYRDCSETRDNREDAFWTDSGYIERWYRGLDVYRSPLDRINYVIFTGGDRFHNERNYNSYPPRHSHPNNNTFRSEPGLDIHDLPKSTSETTIVNMSHPKLISKSDNRHIPVVREHENVIVGNNFSHRIDHDNGLGLSTENDIEENEDEIARAKYREQVGNLIAPKLLPTNPKNVRSMTIAKSLPRAVSSDKHNQNPSIAQTASDKPFKDKYYRKTRNRNNPNVNAVTDKTHPRQPTENTGEGTDQSKVNQQSKNPNANVSVVTDKKQSTKSTETVDESTRQSKENQQSKNPNANFNRVTDETRPIKSSENSGENTNQTKVNLRRIISNANVSVVTGKTQSTKSIETVNEGIKQSKENQQTNNPNTKFNDVTDKTCSMKSTENSGKNINETKVNLQRSDPNANVSVPADKTQSTKSTKNSGEGINQSKGNLQKNDPNANVSVVTDKTQSTKSTETGDEDVNQNKENLQRNNLTANLSVVTNKTRSIKSTENSGKNANETKVNQERSNPNANVSVLTGKTQSTKSTKNSGEGINQSKGNLQKNNPNASVSVVTDKTQSTKSNETGDEGANQIILQKNNPTVNVSTVTDKTHPTQPTENTGEGTDQIKVNQQSKNPNANVSVVTDKKQSTKSTETVDESTRQSKENQQTKNPNANFNIVTNKTRPIKSTENSGENTNQTKVNLQRKNPNTNFSAVTDKTQSTKSTGVSGNGTNRNKENVQKNNLNADVSLVTDKTQSLKTIETSGEDTNQNNLQRNNPNDKIHPKKSAENSGENSNQNKVNHKRVAKQIRSPSPQDTKQLNSNTSNSSHMCTKNNNEEKESKDTAKSRIEPQTDTPKTDMELVEMVSMKKSSGSENSNEFSVFIANQQRLLQAIETNNSKPDTVNKELNISNATIPTVDATQSDTKDAEKGEKETEKSISVSEKPVDVVSMMDCSDDNDSESRGIETVKIKGAVDFKVSDEKSHPTELASDASIFLTLYKRLLASPSNIDNPVLDIKSAGDNKSVLTGLDGSAAKLPKKKKDKITSRLSRKPHNENSNKKKDIIRNALKKLFFDNITQSDNTSRAKLPVKDGATATTSKQVDSAIPFSCITSPEVVGSCTTTSSTQAAAPLDNKPLRLDSSYRAVASLLGGAWEPPAPPTAAAHAPAAPSKKRTHHNVHKMPRSALTATFATHGVPLPRAGPAFSSAAAVAVAAAEEFKKSLDENGNSVQGFSSPQSGSGQQKKQRRKKSSKNETVIKSHHIDGYQGNKDLNEVLRFIESAPERAKRDEKKKPSRKDKPPRAASLDGLRAPAAPAPPARPARPAPPKPERRSWGDGDDARAYFREPEPDAQELTDFQTVTKKRRPRRRADERDPRPRRQPSPRSPPSPPSPPSPRARSGRSDDSNDDLDSVHSLPALPARAPPPLASYADIARTRHNIPDLIESCNYYAEGEAAAPRAPDPPAPRTNQDAYPALEARRPPQKPTAPITRRKERSPPAPDVVADRRPPVVLRDAATPRDLDGVTFGFDVNEQLLGRRPRCDLVRSAAPPALRYVPPPPPTDEHHLHQIVDYVGTAWEDVVRCGGKVRYFSE